MTTKDTTAVAVTVRIPRYLHEKVREMVYLRKAASINQLVLDALAEKIAREALKEPKQ